MNRATLCTDVERAKKFAPFNPEYLKELLDFTYNQEHTACALNMILDAMQGARTVFHHDEREVSENVRLSMQCSWTTFLLGFMRHLFAHGVVVTCLKLDPEGRVVPTLVNVENIILAQYVGEAHRSEYAVYRRKVPGDPDKKDDHDPVSTVFSSMGGFGAPQGAMMQRGDLMKNVMVFEAQDRRPLGGVICSTVSLLHQCWPNVLMAQSSALQAAGRMANPALVMQTQPDIKGTSETSTGLRDNAAVQAALGGMDTHTDLAQLAQYDGRATLYASQVADDNARRLQFASAVLPQSAASVMQTLEAKRVTQNGMPDTERVQLPTGQTLVHQLNATEPRVYERLLLDYTKTVCLMFGVPNSIFSDRGMGTVPGDVGELQRLERRMKQCFTTAESIFTFFWSRITRADRDLRAGTSKTTADGMVVLDDRTSTAGSSTDTDEEEEEEAASAVASQRGRKRKKPSPGPDAEPEIAVYMRANPSMENLLLMWERGMLKWDHMKQVLSQIMCMPVDAFVDHLKPQVIQENALKQEDLEIKERQRQDTVRTQQAQLRQQSQALALKTTQSSTSPAHESKTTTASASATRKR